MKLCEKMQRVPLGRALAATSLGTIATLVVGKKYHPLLGAAWGVLSLWHGAQHLAGHKRAHGHLENFGHFMKHTQVKSFLPGRVRVYNAALVGNDTLIQHITDCIEAIRGVTSVKANPLTGSLLILFDEKLVSGQPALARAAQLLAAKAEITAA